MPAAVSFWLEMTGLLSAILGLFALDSLLQVTKTESEGGERSRSHPTHALKLLSDAS